MPAYLTKVSKLFKRSIHQQEIEIMNESVANQEKEVENEYPEGSIIDDLGAFENVKSLLSGFGENIGFTTVLVVTVASLNIGCFHAHRVLLQYQVS